MALSYLEWHNIVFSYVDTLDGSTSLGKVFCLLSCLTVFVVMLTSLFFFFLVYFAFNLFFFGNSSKH